MYIVLTSNDKTRLNWVCTFNAQEDAIKLAAEIENILEPEEIVCVLPLVYFKQKEK